MLSLVEYLAEVKETADDMPDSDDEEEEELPRWAHGHIFGVLDGAVPLADGHVDDDAMAGKTPAPVDPPQCETPETNTCEHDVAADPIPKKKRKTETMVTAEKQRSYDEFAPPPSDGVRRCSVSPIAHEWMEVQFRTWQRKHNKGHLDLPANTTWYWDQRIECIQQGHITTLHSLDVVRSWLKAYVAKLRQQEPVQENSCIPAAGSGV